MAQKLQLVQFVKVVAVTQIVRVWEGQPPRNDSDGSDCQISGLVWYGTGHPAVGVPECSENQKQKPEKPEEPDDLEGLEQFGDDYNNGNRLKK